MPTSIKIPGLRELCAETLGDSKICIAVLDGPVEQSHSSLAAADLTRIDTLVSALADHGPSLQHGTHVASVIFAHHDGPITLWLSIARFLGCSVRLRENRFDTVPAEARSVSPYITLARRGTSIPLQLALRYIARF